MQISYSVGLKRFCSFKFKLNFSIVWDFRATYKPAVANVFNMLCYFDNFDGISGQLLSRKTSKINYSARNILNQNACIFGLQILNAQFFFKTNGNTIIFFKSLFVISLKRNFFCWKIKYKKHKHYYYEMHIWLVWNL